MTKTNAMRLMAQAGIPIRVQEYAVDESDLSGLHAAEELGMPPEQIFKTLVARGVQMLLSPEALIEYCRMTAADLIE